MSFARIAPLAFVLSTLSALFALAPTVALAQQAAATSNAMLRTYKTTTYPSGVRRTGVAADLDSPAVAYYGQASCPYNGGVPDTYFCIASGDGKFWVAKPAEILDARSLGFVSGATGSDIGPELNLAMSILSTQPGSPSISIPNGDYYFATKLAPQSNVRLVAGGPGATLHYNGVGSTAIENSTVGVLSNFYFDGINLDFGSAANGVIMHAPFANKWHFGQMFQANATGALVSVVADVSSGPQNPNGNYNAAFNDISHIVQSGGSSYSGKCLYISGSGSSTVPVGIVTLNTFTDVNCLDARTKGIEIGHWADTNRFEGSINFVMTADNATCLDFNSSADATKTVYNITMAHVSCAQYTTLSGTTAIKLGYVREINIEAYYTDELVDTQFGSLLTIDTTGTSSYRIVAHGNSPFGSEQINVWQRFISFSDGPTSGLTQNLPILAQQTWNSGGTTFYGYRTQITDTASAAGSIVQSWDVNGSSVMNLLKSGDLNLAGGVAPLGASVFTGTVRADSNFTMNGPVAATALPASGGAGGLYVCVDNAGLIYKKASCP